METARHGRSVLIKPASLASVGAGAPALQGCRWQMAVLQRSSRLTRGGSTHAVARVAIAAMTFVIVVDNGDSSDEGEDY